jgi:hypothetical protein
MSIEEKRKYERRPFVTTTRYYLTTQRTENLEKIYNDAVTVDVSEGGLGIITDYPLASGDILYFAHEIKVNNIVAKSAIVKWAKEIEGNRYRVGLEFRI